MASETVLNSKLLGGVEKLFDDALARAENGPPNPKNYTAEKAGEYDAALNAYHNSFVREQVEKFKAERDDLIKGGNQELAETRYAAKLAGLKKTFMDGTKGGYVDPAKMEQQQQSVMNSLMNFDIPGAIKAFVMGIPFVGDFLGAAGKYIMSQFSGKPITFEQAQEKIKLERALQGGLINIGVNVNARQAQSFVDAHYSTITNRSFTPTPRRDEAQAASTGTPLTSLATPSATFPVSEASAPGATVYPAATPVGEAAQPSAVIC